VGSLTIGKGKNLFILSAQVLSAKLFPFSPTSGGAGRSVEKERRGDETDGRKI